MTVEELIDALKRIEPKSRRVYFQDEDHEEFISIDKVEIDDAGDVILDGEIS